MVADGFEGEFERARGVGDVVEDGDEVVLGGEGGAVAGLRDLEVVVGIWGGTEGAQRGVGGWGGGGDAEEVLRADDDAAGCVDCEGGGGEEGEGDEDDGGERLVKHFCAAVVVVDASEVCLGLTRSGFVFLRYEMQKMRATSGRLRPF